MPLISIIIRSKNEEKWIGHCLSSVFSQNHKDFEVILVDNCSTDSTLKIARRYPVEKILNIDNFLPGLSINEGIRASSGDYIVCLSAHCVPRNESWLANLVSNFKDNNVAGVYGRQLPVAFTEPSDKRDLLTVFGEDKRIQIKDYFFHNANSMFRRDIWQEIPFDEEVTNIEDRVWGKKVIEKGYNLIYEPLAGVFHHHGLHHGNNPERARGVISVIEKVDHNLVNELPESLKPENSNVCAVIPIKDDEINQISLELLGDLILELKSSNFVQEIYILSSEKSFSDQFEVKFIDRMKIDKIDNLSLDEVLSRALGEIEITGIFPDSLIYINHDYFFRPSDIFDDLISKQKINGYDCVFPGLIDYSHYWSKDKFSDFKQNDSSMYSRDRRSPNYKALYGLGCLTSSWLIRSGEMIGGKIGILPIYEARYSMRRKEKDYAWIYDKLKFQEAKLNFT